MKLTKQNQNAGKCSCIRIVGDQRSFVDSADFAYKKGRKTGRGGEVRTFCFLHLALRPSLTLSPDSRPCPSCFGIRPSIRRGPSNHPGAGRVCPCGCGDGLWGLNPRSEGSGKFCSCKYMLEFTEQEFLGSRCELHGLPAWLGWAPLCLESCLAILCQGVSSDLWYGSGSGRFQTPCLSRAELNSVWLDCSTTLARHGFKRRAIFFF